MLQESISTKTSRNVGIDLLRMLAMLMVVILHVLNYGGVIENTKALSLNYETAWFLEIFSRCAVNCFAIISGYVCIKSKYKYSNFVFLWLRAAFYTIAITMLFSLIYPGGGINFLTWLKAFFPVMFKQYWYVTAYFGLFLFMPILNLAGSRLTKNQYKAILVACILGFSFGQTFFQNDTFQFGNGHSVWWLMVLYLFGGYIRQYGLLQNLKKRWLILLYVGSVFLTWMGKFATEYITLHVFGVIRGGRLLLDYTSPTILLSAISLFLIFERLSVKNERLVKIVSICSPLAFSVYLIHTHPLIFENVLKSRFSVFSQFPPAILLLAVLGSAIGIFAFCSLVDFFRDMIFKRLKIKERMQKFENRVIGNIWLK